MRFSQRGSCLCSDARCDYIKGTTPTGVYRSHTGVQYCDKSLMLNSFLLNDNNKNGLYELSRHIKLAEGKVDWNHYLY